MSRRSLLTRTSSSRRSTDCIEPRSERDAELLRQHAERLRGAAQNRLDRRRVRADRDLLGEPLASRRAVIGGKLEAANRRKRDTPCSSERVRPTCADGRETPSPPGRSSCCGSSPATRRAQTGATRFAIRQARRFRRSCGSPLRARAFAPAQLIGCHKFKASNDFGRVSSQRRAHRAAASRAAVSANPISARHIVAHPASTQAVDAVTFRIRQHAGRRRFATQGTRARQFGSLVSSSRRSIGSVPLATAARPIDVRADVPPPHACRRTRAPTGRGPRTAHPLQYDELWRDRVPARPKFDTS